METATTTTVAFINTHQPISSLRHGYNPRNPTSLLGTEHPVPMRREDADIICGGCPHDWFVVQPSLRFSDCVAFTPVQ